MAYSNPWTGKPVDKISALLPRPNGNTCDECGSPCIDNCFMCGAPQCCPACCYDDLNVEPEGLHDPARGTHD